MNRKILQELLQQEGFPPNSYDLNGGLLPERLTLVQQVDGWCVYYSEHGDETGKKRFVTESEACNYLLAEIREDRRIQEMG
jgi:hypothetical protein